MSLDNEKTFICPENKLSCTREEIELLISQLPPSKDCKIKDIDRTDEGIMIAFMNTDNIRFEIFWNAKTNCCYASPVEIVQSYIQTAKESQGMNLVGDLDVTEREVAEVIQELTGWYKNQLIAFINETGKTPDSIEVGFENGGSLTQIKRHTHDLLKLILKNRAKPSEPTPLNNPENENMVGDKILILSVKLMAGSIGIEKLTTELGFTKQTVKKFTEGKGKWMRQTTEDTLTQWFNHNAEKIRELLKNEELVNRFLTVSEQEVLNLFFEHELPVAKKT